MARMEDDKRMTSGSPQQMANDEIVLWFEDSLIC